MTIDTRKNKPQILLVIYERLYNRYGPQHWWPAEEPFEVIVGAILTQSASWTNVEKSIASLKKANALLPEALRKLSCEELAGLIHSCGYYHAKAAKLKAFAEWLKRQYRDSLEFMFRHSTDRLRKELLQVHGVGEETADSILLYAGNRPIFVIDAYTRRIIDRLGLKPKRDKYCHYQNLFMKNLLSSPEMFNEYHALLVALGKEVCHKKPICEQCCLQDICSVS